MTDREEPEIESEEEEAQERGPGVFEIVRLIYSVTGREIAAQKWLFAIALFFAVLATACESGAPMLLEKLINDALPQKDLQKFIWLSAGILLLMLGFLLLWMVQISFSVRASEFAFMNFRRRLIGQILHKDDSFFTKHSSGDIMTRLSNDVDLVQSHFYGYIVLSLADLIYVLSIVAFLFIWNWRMALTVLAIFPVYGAVVKISSRPIHLLSLAARQKLSALNNTLIEIIGGQRTIRFYQQERNMSSRFGERCHDLAEANIRAIRKEECALMTIDSVTTAMTLLPFLIGGLFIFRNSDAVRLSDLVVTYTYLNFLSTSIKYPFDSLTSLSRIAPALARVKEVCEYPEAPEKKLAGIEETPDGFSISVENVSYTYEAGNTALKDISLTVAPGEKIAIMGPSGCGKSTLLNIILRFLEPTSGNLKFGGRNARDYPLAFYLSFFSYVSQDTYVFNMSVRDNVAMGWYNVPDETVSKALAVARLDNTLGALPDGVDTVLGDRGFSFSGGQRQRLAMARALVRDPEILVLDEFTSALDRDVQNEILDDLLSIFSAQTIICVTHSEDVASRFDRILRLAPVIVAG
jgi:ATP-binding cassette, subfamily B, bacterial MsbA